METGIEHNTIQKNIYEPRTNTKLKEKISEFILNNRL